MFFNTNNKYNDVKLNKISIKISLRTLKKQIFDFLYNCKEKLIYFK